MSSEILLCLVAVRLSVGVIESAVDLPVPTEVRVESKQ